jgi:hypothetical protein
MGGRDDSDEGNEDEKKASFIPSTTCCCQYVLEWQDPATTEPTSCQYPLITWPISLWSVMSLPLQVYHSKDCEDRVGNSCLLLHHLPPHARALSLFQQPIPLCISSFHALRLLRSYWTSRYVLDWVMSPARFRTTTCCCMGSPIMVIASAACSSLPALFEAICCTQNDTAIVSEGFGQQFVFTWRA